jgi:O-methyltransferase
MSWNSAGTGMPAPEELPTQGVGHRDIKGGPEELVLAAYRAVLRREPDPEGFATYVDLVRNGCGLRDLLEMFISSPEFANDVYPALRDSWAVLTEIGEDASRKIPDWKFYTPLFSPWRGYGDFPLYYNRCVGKTLVSPDRCHVLYQIALQALRIKGNFWECGVYKGGTAALLSEVLFRNAPNTEKQIYLFDTFSGMPDTDSEKDFHNQGDFSDTSLREVMMTVGHGNIASYYPGIIPETFAGLEQAEIALAHIDVDIYNSVMECCKFIFPRLSFGGFMIFDDYCFPSCPGARKAVDEYFLDTGFCPIVLPTGQAIIFKSTSEIGDDS